MVAPRTPPAIVLVRPREEGNVGSSARAMANTGHHQMLLVEPAALLGDISRRFAVGAHHVLDFAARHASLAEALAPFRRVVATTSTRDRKLEVPLLTPHELPAVLAEDPPDLPTAIVFGPEVGGLTGTELALAHVVVHIPCAPEQPTLNLSQAVLILGYELFQARRVAGESPSAAPGTAMPFEPATAAEVEGMFAHISEVLGAVGFDRDDSFERVLRDLRQLAGRTELSVREVRILRGICRRTANALSGKGRESPSATIV